MSAVVYFICFCVCVCVCVLFVLHSSSVFCFEEGVGRSRVINSQFVGVVCVLGGFVHWDERSLRFCLVLIYA